MAGLELAKEHKNITNCYNKSVRMGTSVVGFAREGLKVSDKA